MYIRPVAGAVLLQHDIAGVVGCHVGIAVNDIESSRFSLQESRLSSPISRKRELLEQTIA